MMAPINKPPLRFVSIILQQPCASGFRDTGGRIKTCKHAERSDPKQPPDPCLHFTVRVRLSGRPYPGRILHRSNWTSTWHFVLVLCSLLNVVEI
jgi:hypothetical protein